MLKPSGIWVSPAEVEARLLAHETVLQAAVVDAGDADGLERLVAFVILQPSQSVTEAELIEFCRQGLPSVLYTAPDVLLTARVNQAFLRRGGAILVAEKTVPTPVVIGVAEVHRVFAMAASWPRFCQVPSDPFDSLFGSYQEGIGFSPVT